MTPEFCRRASIVLDSPYFESEEVASEEESDRLFNERRLLRDAVGPCDSYEELEGKAKEIWDRAEPPAIAAQKEYEEFAANDTGGYGRFCETMDTNPGKLVDVPAENREESPVQSPPVSP